MDWEHIGLHEDPIWDLEGKIPCVEAHPQKEDEPQNNNTLELAFLPKSERLVLYCT